MAASLLDLMVLVKTKRELKKHKRIGTPACGENQTAVEHLVCPESYR
jgi:hypothetical protein